MALRMLWLPKCAGNQNPCIEKQSYFMSEQNRKENFHLAGGNYI